MTPDAVNPQHYRNPSGVQIIEVIRSLPFSLGNAMKYAYRNARKENAVQDLKKALWYLEDYREHPTPAHGAVKALSPEVLKAVLEGVDPFEKSAFEALLEVGRTSLGGEAFASAVEAAHHLLQERLLLLEGHGL